MNQLARQLIAENKQLAENNDPKCKSLDLGNCGLKELPEGLFELIWLEELNICNGYYKEGVFIKSQNKGESNYLSTIPRNIEQLQNIQVLRINARYYNKWGITDISPLKKLKKLIILDLHGNNIKDANVLENFMHLEYLNIHSNQVSDISFLKNLKELVTLNVANNSVLYIPNLEHLSKIRYLDLRSNKISDISSLKNLFQTSAFKRLDISSNNIKNLTPILPLIKRGASIKWSSLKDGICVQDNPLTTPPIEIVKEGNQAILNYFKELEEGEETVYEAKLLIIGEAGAGKTSLKRKIGDCEADLPDEAKDTTTGIDITQHTFAATADLPEFTMNIWDFGGQEVYHATHQFFLSKRSLYVLVDDGRKEDNNSYWMQTQELFGEGSPLLLFLNQKGTIQRQIPLNDLKGEFPNIQELTTINLKTEADKIPDYCRTLEYYIRNLPQFKRGETLPRKWVRIREILEEREENYISISQFRQICRKEGIKENKRQDFLSDYLHDLGALLHFQDSPLLKRMVVLRPEWATNAVYAILNHTEQTGKNGQFTYDDLNEVWQSHEYQDVFEELLALMQKFELCYRLKNNKNRFIVPQLLSKDKPDFEWIDDNNLELRYEYDFMPKGILTRFIVRRHKFIEGQRLVWQRGVVLEYKNARALVVEEYRSNAIKIQVKGAFPQNLMSIVTDEIDDINSGFHFNERMKVRKMVPCICPTCNKSKEPEVRNYEKLVKKLNQGKNRYYCNTGEEFFSISAALYNIGDHSQRDAKFHSKYKASVYKSTETPQKVFIAYDDADVAHMKSLTKHLGSLERNGLLQTWSVNQRLAGSDKEAVLAQQLEEAGVILLLISVDFVNSDACMQHILEVAMEKSAADLATVIPIYVRPCDCDDLPFDDLQALPNNKSKEQYVTLWANQEAAWLNVAKGIKAVLKG